MLKGDAKMLKVLNSSTPICSSVLEFSMLSSSSFTVSNAFSSGTFGACIVYMRMFYMASFIKQQKCMTILKS